MVIWIAVKYRKEVKKMKKSSIIMSVFVFLLSLFSCNIFAENKKQESSGMKIKIKVTGDSGTSILEGTLADNSSALAFYNLVKKNPLTVKMSDYGSFEKVGSLGTNLPRNDTKITTVPGDIILYQGNQITIYYDKNTWNFTRLGKIDGLSQKELKDVLGQGSITAVFSAE